MSMEDEKLWLVGEDDLPIGEGWQWRDGKTVAEGSKNDKNFRVINAFVKRSDGKLWIPRRSAEKGMLPLCLDYSVGGHVEFPETYEETFKRETMEEINVDISKTETVFLGMLSPFETHGIHAFMKVWEIHLEEAPDYNKKDFSEYYWLAPHELREKVASGDCAKGDLIPVLDAFYPSRA